MNKTSLLICCSVCEIMQILPKMLSITVVVVYGIGVKFSFRLLNKIFYFISPYSVLYYILLL